MISGKGDSPQLALNRLDAQRISFARELRGLTKKDLAEKIKKTSSAISQIERGLIRPDLETLISIAFALKVPTTFFIQREILRKSIDLDTCHFRSRRSTSQALRRQSARKGDLIIDFMELLESLGVIFPEEQVTKFSLSVSSDEEIEQAASNLRRQWNLGYGPIPDIVRLVESKGIIALPLYDSCNEVDAYSTWRGGRPCMLLSYLKTPSRVRFDVSHELGHLLFHEDTATGDAKTERQANRFAGAFLAPQESFYDECPRSWSFEAFRQLKFRWKMSIAALLYRAKDLGCLSTSSYQRAMIQFRHYRKNEGPEWPMEKPTMVKQALELLKDNITLEGIAAEMTLYPAELKELLAQCVPIDLLNQLDRKKNKDSAKIVKLRKS